MIRTGILFAVSICKGGIIGVGEIIGIVSINSLLMLDMTLDNRNLSRRRKISRQFKRRQCTVSHAQQENKIL